MTYVDASVVAVPRDKLEQYKAFAQTAAAIWKEHGALAYHEVIGDDVPYGELTSFPRAVQAKDDEIVCASWIVYASREDRDAILQKVMADPRMKMDDAPENWPFDGKRMIMGGFDTVVQV